MKLYVIERLYDGKQFIIHSNTTQEEIDIFAEGQDYHKAKLLFTDNIEIMKNINDAIKLLKKYSYSISDGISYEKENIIRTRVEVTEDFKRKHGLGYNYSATKCTKCNRMILGTTGVIVQHFDKDTNIGGVQYFTCDPCINDLKHNNHSAIKRRQKGLEDGCYDKKCKRNCTRCEV